MCQQVIAPETLEFEAALDGLQPQKSDVILVLRNWDDVENEERAKAGAGLLQRGWADTMMLLAEENTRSEALHMSSLAYTLHWQRILLITHRYHSYRAYLTFVRAFTGWEWNVKLYMYSLKSGVVLGERDKIRQYSTKGDCATYKEGLEYLKWLSDSR